MKKLLLISIVLSTALLADLTMDEIRDMVTKIHEKREGVSLDILETTQEPFASISEENNTTIFITPKKAKEKATKLSLHAILNGKVYINDKWISVGDDISGLTLKYIGQKGVILRNGNQIKKLFLHQKRENFITIEERE